MLFGILGLLAAPVSVPVITEGGVYSLGGSLEEGQIFVDADSEETVVLVLNGVDIRNKDEAAIHVESAGHTSL